MKESHVALLCETGIDQAVVLFVSGTLLSVNPDWLIVGAGVIAIF